MVVIELLIDIGGSGHYQVRGPPALPLLCPAHAWYRGVYIYLSHSLHTETSDKYCNITKRAFGLLLRNPPVLFVAKVFQLRVALRQDFTTFFVNFLAQKRL